jgi:CheY-like chemotaxis protein
MSLADNCRVRAIRLRRRLNEAGTPVQIEKRIGERQSKRFEKSPIASCRPNKGYRAPAALHIDCEPEAGTRLCDLAFSGTPMAKQPGKKLILLVEDEPLILMDFEDALSEAGYQVVSARTCDRALEQLTKRDDIGAVITDIKLPGQINGLQLVAAIRDRWPWLKIIIVTGDPGAPDVPFDVPIFQKPVIFSQFLARAKPLLPPLPADATI